MWEIVTRTIKITVIFDIVSFTSMVLVSQQGVRGRGLCSCRRKLGVSPEGLACAGSKTHWVEREGGMKGGRDVGRM